MKIELPFDFTNEEVCRGYLIHVRWPNTVRCARCDYPSCKHWPHRAQWTCFNCGYLFSIRSGTAMQGSHLPIKTWLHALALFANGTTASYAMAKELGVTQKTAWYLTHRIRAALTEGVTFIDPSVDTEAILEDLRRNGGRTEGKYSIGYVAQAHFLLTSEDARAAFYELSRALMESTPLPLKVLQEKPRALCKLNPNAVRKIRTLRASGTRAKDLASMFNVNRHTIQNVISGRSWKGVT